jgi:phage N-6-adenine-methyltransferase
VQGRKQVFSTGKDDWTTPRYIFDYYNSRYNFTLDAAADSSNALCSKFYTIEDNALSKSWMTTNSVWCNPPYSIAKKFIAKAYQESVPFGCFSGVMVVMLIAARVSNREWHDYIFGKAARVTFIKGRVKFGDAALGAPFPSAIVVWDYKAWLANGCKTEYDTIDEATMKSDDRAATLRQTSTILQDVLSRREPPT